MVALGLAVAAVAGVSAGSWQGPVGPPSKLAAVEVTAQPMSAPNALLAEPLPSPPATTERVSVTNNDGQANSGSGGASALIASANGDQAISGDGRWVAFVSTATNLVPGGSQPGGLYLRDRQDGTTTAIPWIGGEPFPTSVVAAEPAINQDGSVVAFTVIVITTLRGVAVVGGEATPYVLAWDRAIGTELVSMDDAGQPSPGFQPSISADGRYVAYTRWAPLATPPPNTPPALTNLRITSPPRDINDGRFYVFAPAAPCTPHEATFQVTATDAEGPMSSVTLSYQPPGGSATTVFMSNVGSNVWQFTLNIPNGWGAGQITYWTQATDSNGVFSSQLFGTDLLYNGECLL